MKEINPGQDLSRQKTEAGTSLGAELLGLEHCRYFQKERESQRGEKESQGGSEIGRASCRERVSSPV